MTCCRLPAMVSVFGTPFSGMLLSSVKSKLPGFMVHLLSSIVAGEMCSDMDFPDVGPSSVLGNPKPPKSPRSPKPYVISLASPHLLSISLKLV